MSNEFECKIDSVKKLLTKYLCFGTLHFAYFRAVIMPL